MFKYFMPTKILSGEEIVKNNPQDLILGKKAMIVTGKTSGEKSGALSDILSVLEENKVEYLVYNHIGNNPTLEEVAEGGKCAREFGADFLIGVGGGSPLDAAKAIAVFAKNPPITGSDFDLYDIFLGTHKNKPLPMAAIPTTAGTGSEVTPYSILTLHKEQNKKSFSHPDVFYKVAFLDGKYIKNIPLQIARNTMVDTMSHLIEGYTTKRSTPASDYIAIEGLKILGTLKDNFIDGNFSDDELQKLLWASTLGGMVIAQTGTTIVHAMGYHLTYFKDIAHGMANGLLLCQYLKRAGRVLPQKFEDILKCLGMTFDELREYLTNILPCSTQFSADDFPSWAKVSINAKSVPFCPFDITEAEEVEIYNASLIK